MTNKGKASLLLIYTGGTIGMKADTVDGTLHPFDFKGILEEVPELGKFAYRLDSFSFDPIIDSSDIEPSIWQDLARIIRDEYDKYDGFVVLHGTDTMAYSASALSFMLDNLSKPVVFTGSQLPIGVPRTDGKENLISSVEIAASRNAEGHPRVPEVCIFFNNKLMRGNRTTKYSSDKFNAFSSPNASPLAEAGITIRYNDGMIRRPTEWDKGLTINLDLDTRVGILKIHPGITAEVVSDVLCGKSTRAVIIETYGSGNAPSKPWFLELVRKAAREKILLNITQCFSGTVDMDIYSNGKALQLAGVVSGQDMTTESALAKLFHLMGNCSDNKEVIRLIQENLRGEI